jgi:hypothetical protein
MGSCLRRNPELDRMAPTGISFGIFSSEQMNYRISAVLHRFAEQLSSALQGPCEGRDPSCNRSAAGEMGSRLRRNPELPRLAATWISFDIAS